jgi:hypothetical protein
MTVQTPEQIPGSSPPQPPPFGGFSQSPVQPPLVTKARGDLRGTWVAIGGAAATFIGALLPWVNGPFGISVNGTSGDGIIAIILSLPMAGFAWLMVRKRWASVPTMIFSILTIALMAFEVVHISSASPLASLGFGVIVCLVGGVAGLLGGILARRANPMPIERQ